MSPGTRRCSSIPIARRTSGRRWSCCCTPPAWPAACASAAAATPNASRHGPSPAATAASTGTPAGENGLPQSRTNGMDQGPAEDAEDETVLIRDTHQVLRFVWNHPGNKGQRGQALLRAVSYQARARLLGRQSRVRIGDHSYIWASLHRPGSSKAVYGNPPDHPEMLVWQRRLGPGDLFVDVGANVGSYSILAGDLGASVIALEPAPDTFALLAENVQLNGYPVTMLEAAAGATCGTARFTSGQDAVNRLAADGPGEIEMVTLETVIGDQGVAGVKIDCEGVE